MTAESAQDDRERLTRWLHGARRGDRAAFNHLCTPGSLQRIHVAVASSLPRDLRSRIDPEDVVQEVLEQAFRTIGELRDVSTQGFHRWLAGIARHEVIDIIRRHRAEKRNPGREVRYRTSFQAGDGALRDSHTPSRSVAQREQLARIVGVLDMLKSTYRDVLVYRYLEGRTSKETAALLGMTSGNASVTKMRALKKLGQLLEERGIKTTIFRPL